MKHKWITMLTKILILAFASSSVAGTYHWAKEEEHYSPQPYRFGYEVKDKEGKQYRHEEGNGHGIVKGSYGYTDEKGIYREVHYIADKGGFRAKVKTNEPGTANQNSADVKVEAHPQNHEYHNVHVVQDHKPYIHKIEVAPKEHHYSPPKQHHYQNFRSYNWNDNYSPVHGYSYRPSSFFNFMPFSGEGNHYMGNTRSHIGSYNFNIPNYKNYHGMQSFNNHQSFNGYGNNVFKNADFEKFFPEMKHKNQFQYSGSLGGFNSNIGGFNGYNNLNKDEIEKFIQDIKDKNQYSNSGKYGGLNINSEGFNGYSNFDNGKIESFLEDFKNENKFGYSGKLGGINSNVDFNGYDGLSHNGYNNMMHEGKFSKPFEYSGSLGKINHDDYHFEEFRNIGDHKYKRSSKNNF